MDDESKIIEFNRIDDSIEESPFPASLSHNFSEMEMVIHL